jgi:hypothetical protein
MNSIEVDFAAVDESREDRPVWCVRQRRTIMLDTTPTAMTNLMIPCFIILSFLP